MKLLTTLILFGSTLFATAADREQSVGKCLTLIKKECPNDGFNHCVEKAKERKNLLECHGFLMRENNKERIEKISELNPNIQKEVRSVSFNEDQQKCREVSEKICGEGESMDDCIKNKAGSFPSFCRESSFNGIGDLKKSVETNSSITSCTKGLMTACELKLPEAKIKPDVKAYQAAMKTYQGCLNKRAEKEANCQSLIKTDKKSGATQLIR